MSWAGMLYDLLIPFLLLWRPSRPLAYLAVVAFHVLTALLFPIGMFPWIMMVSTLVFFTLEDYQPLARRLRLPAVKKPSGDVPAACKRSKLVLAVLSIFFVFRIGMCLRHVAYPGDVLWTEEGYRFSWRVMLAEKTGHATFWVVQDEEQGDKTWTVYPSEYLTPQQAKQMAFQPDMILQFAHFLARDARFGPDAQVYRRRLGEREREAERKVR